MGLLRSINFVPVAGFAMLFGGLVAEFSWPVAFVVGGAVILLAELRSNA